MTETLCEICGSKITERPGRKSKRPGELLLICAQGHKWQGCIVEGHLHLYRSNYPGMVGEKRKVKTITVSPDEQELMDNHGISQQAVFLMGLDILRGKQ